MNVPQQNMLGNSVTGLLYNKNEDKSHWGEPKTLKDGAQPKYNRQVYPNINATASYGPNRETGSMPIPEDENLKKLYREYLKRIGETEGVNREIAQTNFLDPRGQNPIEKIMEKNHFDLSDSKTVVTKDNIYTQPKEKIEIALNETGTFVNSKLYDLKRQREDLLFDVRYGKIDSDDPEIEKVNYDIEYLQHIEKKIKMGLKYHYAFEKDDLNRLSQMNIDDILNSKEEFSQNLPYLSPLAQTIRATGKGLDAYQNSVGVVENIGVEYDLKKELFTIFDKNNPQNKFSFSASLISNPKGYSEYIITPGKNAYKSAEYIQYDLLKALDGKAISKQSIDKLKDIALNDTKSVGKVVDFIGYAIDFADFWIVMDSDKEFNGGEIGVDTYKAGGELIGSIAGDRFGSIAGAKAGAVIGTAAFGPIGTVIGSVLGAAAGAYLLSSVMEEIGEYLGEYVYEYQPADPIQ